MNIKYEIIFRLKKIYWLVARPKRQGVKCVIEHDGKILLIRRSFGTTKYVFPGGAIKPNETPEKALRREIKEDLGLALEAVRAKGNFAQDVHHRHETIFVFAATINNTDIKFDQGKIQDIAWFEPSEIPELTPITQSVLAKYSATG